MAIILRLQGLDVKASTEDIRKFFKCLQIPEGGVYIVGGSLREAFIAFATERDAQLAMRNTGNFLKGSRVTLHISNMEELEHKLESLLKKKKKKQSPSQLTGKGPEQFPDERRPSLNAWPHNHNPESPQPSIAWSLDPNLASLPQPLYTSNADLQPPPVQSLDSNAAFLLGVYTVLQGLQSSPQTQNKETQPGIDLLKADNTIVSDELKTPEIILNSTPGYVRLFGLPSSATKDDICRFFRGLTVQEAIVNVKLGLSHGCLVKFASMQDACDALGFNQQSLGAICVEVRGATEKLWNSALQECENSDNEERVKSHDNPVRETAKHRPTPALPLNRQSVKRLPSKMPKRPRPDCDSGTLSHTVEYIVMVRNLSKEMTKTEIKQLFGCPNISHKKVLHLLDKERNRTDTAFLIFNCTDDYNYAMNLSGCHVGSDIIEVSSVTKEKMRDMMAKTLPRSIKNYLNKPTKLPNLIRKSHTADTQAAPSWKPDLLAHTCLFVRNMPAHVQKSHIKELFSKYKVNRDNIRLLHDNEGKGLGEAVVQFKSRMHAALALKLNGQDFLGSQVLLTLINVKQMKNILSRCH
ncbi:RNA-binding protein 12B RNA-binding motif protein 12B [Channa argus]|uniref:RNA-binding protein 12B RNA-binding motif protein 12B n=1 Tax=Channa argus TaxID=215402 RepID=A0A6G1PNQ3_CHAAH|nr:RNA-binding protein 12B RNA-binding motif protein 12B [Channa argus]KAK2910267.1 hypothetical protein Q8A73_007982 [Channa argus]